MKKFMTSGYIWKPRIEEVEVERESDSCVWVKGRRLFKRTQYENYFDTWEDAHAFLLGRAEIELESASRSLESAKGHYGNIKGMRKPS